MTAVSAVGSQGDGEEASGQASFSASASRQELDVGVASPEAKQEGGGQGEA